MAGGARDGDDDSLVTDINVTPLVDVMLCLLVIFMVTTTYVVADSIKIDLPNAASGDTTAPSTLAIMFTKERKLYLNGAETTDCFNACDSVISTGEGSSSMKYLVRSSENHGFWRSRAWRRACAQVRYAPTLYISQENPRAAAAVKRCREFPP